MNAAVNRLNKTKVERVVDHELEKVEREREEARVKRAAAIEKVRPPPSLFFPHLFVSSSPVD